MPPTSPLTHFDAQGQAHMVDVAAKADTHRIAIASGRIVMQAGTLALVQAGTARKGDVLGIARVAGIMAAKRTSDLIPLCHPLALTRVAIDISNRPYLIWHVKIPKPKLGEMDTELFKEWFHAFAMSAGLTLHVETLYGTNTHHMVESCYKGLARALRIAVEIDPRQATAVPSTKGVL